MTSWLAATFSHSPRAIALIFDANGAAVFEGDAAHLRVSDDRQVLPGASRAQVQDTAALPRRPSRVVVWW